MLELNTTTKFRKDYKLCIKRRYNMELLEKALDTLRIPSPLPLKNKDHDLVGEYKGCRECHLLPDWVLIYRVEGNTLYLVRTGSHSDLFDM